MCSEEGKFSRKRKEEEKAKQAPKKSERVVPPKKTETGRSKHLQEEPMEPVIGRVVMPLDVELPSQYK